MEKLLHSDSRGRLSLGKFLEPDTYYMVTVNEHGTITLSPVTLVTAQGLEKS